jgi:hypothetical protein
MYDLLMHPLRHPRIIFSDNRSSIARRTGQPSMGKIRKAKTDAWLGMLEAELPEKRPAGTGSLMGGTPPSGRRGLRTLPFSSTSFRNISSGFYVHGSIARVISRADIPIFTAATILMGGDGAVAPRPATGKASRWPKCSYPRDD